jgi:uncharacterized protein
MKLPGFLVTPGAPAPSARSWLLVGTIAWGLVVALAFVALQIVTTAFLALRGHGGITEEEALALFGAATTDGSTFAIATLASTAVLVPAVLGIAKLKRGAQLRSYFALHPVPARVLAGWLSVTLAFLALSDGLTLLLGKPIVPEFIRLAYATAQPVWPLWLAFVVAAPLFEEALFRGFLFTGFQASSLGSAGTVIVTSLLWAAIHLQYDLYGIATIFGLGVVFGVARVATRSIYVPIVLHATSNLIATLEAAWLA